MKSLPLFSLLCSTLAGALCFAGVAEVVVRGGVYEPFFPEKDETRVVVRDLIVDKDPVTNKDYLQFVRQQRQWSRSKIPQVFTAQGYLKHWRSDFEFDRALSTRPVTHVSWFAARAYCKSQGKRLLTVNEWEYVSDAQNPRHLGEILDWYGTPAHQLKGVEKAVVNKFGLRGLHGLIWEWTEDFSSVIITGDSRDGNDAKAEMFCGSGSLRSKDPAQYATFMRFAHRSSLDAKYIGGTLGFRCAKDVKEKP